MGCWNILERGCGCESCELVTTVLGQKLVCEFVDYPLYPVCEILWALAFVRSRGRSLQEARRRWSNNRTAEDSLQHRLLVDTRGRGVAGVEVDDRTPRHYGSDEGGTRFSQD